MSNEDLKTLQHQAEAELGNLLCRASQIIVDMANRGLTAGNPYHAQLAISEFGVAELRSRWKEPQPGLNISTDWQKHSSQQKESA